MRDILIVSKNGEILFVDCATGEILHTISSDGIYYSMCFVEQKTEHVVEEGRVDVNNVQMQKRNLSRYMDEACGVFHKTLGSKKSFEFCRRRDDQDCRQVFDAHLKQIDNGDSITFSGYIDYKLIKTTYKNVYNPKYDEFANDLFREFGIDIRGKERQSDIKYWADVIAQKMDYRVLNII